MSHVFHQVKAGSYQSAGQVELKSHAVDSSHKPVIQYKKLRDVYSPQVAAATTCFTATTPVNLDFNPYWFLPERFYLKVTLSSSAATELLPPNYWFSRIVFKTNSGRDMEIGAIEGDALDWCSNGLRKLDWSQKHLNERNGLSPAGDFTSYFIPASTNTDFYIDLSATALGMLRPYGRSLGSDTKLRVVLTPRSSIVLRKAAGALSDATITCNGISLVVDHYKVKPEEEARILQEHSNRSLVRCLPQKLPTSTKSTTWTAGTAVDINLSSHYEACSFMLFAIKETPVAGTDADYKDAVRYSLLGKDDLFGPYVYLGDDTTFQIRNYNGTDMISEGTLVSLATVREWMHNNLPNDYLEKHNVVMIPFCDDPTSAFWNGVRKGELPASPGAEYVLRIIPGTATTAPSRITMTATAGASSAGDWVLSYGGYSSRAIPDGSADDVVNMELRGLLTRFGRRATITDSKTLESAGVKVTFAQGKHHTDGKYLIASGLSDDAIAQVWSTGTPGNLTATNDQQATTYVEMYMFNPQVLSQKGSHWSQAYAR